jgi:hypothetical protein
MKTSDRSDAICVGDIYAILYKYILNVAAGIVTHTHTHTHIYIYTQHAGTRQSSDFDVAACTTPIFTDTKRFLNILLYVLVSAAAPEIYYSRVLHSHPAAA